MQDTTFFACGVWKNIIISIMSFEIYGKHNLSGNFFSVKIYFYVLLVRLNLHTKWGREEKGCGVGDPPCSNTIIIIIFMYVSTVSADSMIEPTTVF
jgi:hypothetical protein